MFAGTNAIITQGLGYSAATPLLTQGYGFYPRQDLSRHTRTALVKDGRTWTEAP